MGWALVEAGCWSRGPGRRSKVRDAPLAVVPDLGFKRCQVTELQQGGIPSASCPPSAGLAGSLGPSSNPLCQALMTPPPPTPSPAFVLTHPPTHTHTLQPSALARSWPLDSSPACAAVTEWKSSSLECDLWPPTEESKIIPNMSGDQLVANSSLTTTCLEWFILVTMRDKRSPLVRWFWTVCKKLTQWPC